MNRQLKRGVGIAALMIIAAVVWTFYWRGPTSAEESRTASSGSSHKPAPDSDAADIDSTTKQRQQLQAPLEKVDSQDKSAESSHGTVSNISQNAGVDGRMPESSTIKSGVDGPTVRVPFKVSESIRRECVQMAHLGKANCDEQLKAIAQLKNERRDAQWADAIEESMRTIVNRQPGFRVRALECGTSICAIEIESSQDIFSRTHFDSIATLIEDVDLIFAYEHTSAGERIKVTSIAFERL